MPPVVVFAKKTDWPAEIGTIELNAKLVICSGSSGDIVTGECSTNNVALNVKDLTGETATSGNIIVNVAQPLSLNNL